MPGSDLASLAAGLRPMKAVAGELPSASGWAFEVKWDGMRVLAEVHRAAIPPPTGRPAGRGVPAGSAMRLSAEEPAGTVRLRSGRGSDVTVSYPELAVLADCVGGHDVLLDGEVVALGGDGVPSFSLLQQRMHVNDPAAAAQRAAEVPVTFIAFDLLHLDGESLLGLPWSQRRALLDDVVQPNATVQVSPRWIGSGDELLEVARQRGLEGVVAKRVDSPYRAGRRATAWRKVKVRNTQEFVVVGWLSGTGARERTVGSLLVGCRRDGELVAVGQVGSGLGDADLRWWSDRLADTARDDCALATIPPVPPRRRAHWVDPVDVVQVEFAEWTPDGRLRHPVYVGRRTDADAAEVTCDP